LADDLVERVRVAAETSVGRAVGFAALGIGCVVLGLSSYPVLALRSGAGLSLLTAAVLYLHALRAEHRPYRRTETWLLVDWPAALPQELAQRLIGTALGRALQRYAHICAAAAVLFWLGSLTWAVLERLHSG
jgi:hypothetical protein